MLSRREWAGSGEQPHWSFLFFVFCFWQDGYIGCKNVWTGYSLETEEFGVVFVISIPAPSSQGEEKFLSCFNFDWKCHGIDA